MLCLKREIQWLFTDYRLHVLVSWRNNLSLKAMLHEAIFLATCLATMTTEKHCKLQRGCHTFAIFFRNLQRPRWKLFTTLSPPAWNLLRAKDRPWSVSVRRRLQTADCRLQTRGKMQTEGKMPTADCRPGVKCRLKSKTAYRVWKRLKLVLTQGEKPTRLLIHVFR